MAIHESRPISLAKRRRAIFLALAVTCLVTWSQSSWAKPNDAIPYPVGYPEWAQCEEHDHWPKASKEPRR
jgi:hypothetical protein